jgi:hypothetical protein
MSQTLEAAVLAEREGEFRTHKVIRIGDDYFDVDENGGSRGAWEVKNGSGATRATVVDCTEARRILLEMEIELDEVVRLTGETQ